MRATKTKTKIRQEQIAQAALLLIARQGYHQLSVARVAQEVGVTPSAIYRHFQSKDKVVDAVLDLISQRLLEITQAVRGETSHSLDRLQKLLEKHVCLIQNDTPIPRVVFSEEIFVGNPGRRRRVHQIFQQYLEKVAEMIQEGQCAGEIRKELVPATLSMMFLGLVQPGAILWLLSDGGFDLNLHVQSAWQIFRAAIQAQEARPTHHVAVVKTNHRTTNPIALDCSSPKEKSR